MPATREGEILEALNNKTDRDMRNVDIPSGADVVVEWQAPTAENNYKWYRKYMSGWIEQGGQNNTLNTTITFPVEMADTNYQLLFVGFCIANHGRQSYSKSTTGFTTSSNSNNSETSGWYVCGMAA